MAQTRMTKQRAVILEVLRGVTSHPTADEIYSMVREKLPRISLGTVYRNLDLLAGAGDIQLLDRAGTQRHFDGNPEPHQHVRCRCCGSIGDVPEPLELPAHSGMTVPGFSIEAAEIEFIGLCDTCRHTIA